MKCIVVFTILVAFTLVPQGEGFSYFVHRAISEVAQSLLTKDAQEGVRHYLGNTTLAEIAVDADEYRQTLPFFLILTISHHQNF